MSHNDWKIHLLTPDARQHHSNVYRWNWFLFKILSITQKPNDVIFFPCLNVFRNEVQLKRISNICYWLHWNRWRENRIFHVNKFCYFTKSFHLAWIEITNIQAIDRWFCFRSCSAIFPSSSSCFSSSFFFVLGKYLFSMLKFW